MRAPIPLLVVAIALLGTTFACGGDGAGQGAADGLVDAVDRRDTLPDRVVPPPDAPDVAPDVTRDVEAEDAGDAEPPPADVVPDVGPDVFPDTSPDVSFDGADASVCCVTDEDCAGDFPNLGPCEAVRCNAAACSCERQRQEPPACCANAAECDDGDPDTLESCPVPGGVCVYAPRPVCASDADCAAEIGPLGACEAARCDPVAQACVIDTTPAPYCCLSDGDCPSGARCSGPGGDCRLFACGGAAPLEPWALDFDHELGDLAVYDWNEDDRVGWHLVVDNAHAGRALYLGDPACAWYFNGEDVDDECATPYPEILDPDYASGVRIDLVSPELTLPAGVSYALGFWIAGQGEPPFGVPGLPDPDSLVVRVEDTSSGHVEVVFDTATWDNYLPTPTYVSTDLSVFAGQAVRVTFTFDTYGPDHNRYSGWWLDEIVLRSHCLHCEADRDCLDGDACTVDTCTPFWNGDGSLGICARNADPPGCRPCLDASDCSDGDLCTLDRCDAGVCTNDPDPQPPCCEETLTVAHDFAGGALPDGWQVEGDAGPVRWQVIPDPESGDPLLWFGDAETGTYEAGAAVAGRVVSAPIALPLPESGRFFHLAAWFRLRLETEFDAVPFDPSLPVDRLSLRVVYPDPAGGGAVEDELWSSSDPSVGGTTAGDTVTVATDLTPWAGRTVRLAFVFETFDELENGFEGPFVDDLTVQTLCGETCGEDRDCDDGDPCTLDVCEGLACVHAIAFDGCCATIGDCRPGDACTTVACNAGRCVFNDDGDDATCCDGAPAWEALFASPTLGTFDVVTEAYQDPLPPATWYATGRCARSEPFGVAFGDPVTGDYATGYRVGGSLTTPRFTIPTSGPDAKTWLSFALNLDTEWNGVPRDGWEDPPSLQPDALTVSLVRGDQEVPLWTSFAIETRGSTCRPGVASDCGWRTIELDLTPWQGVSAALRFTFDSFDDIDNAHPGVCLDDIVVESTCDGAAIECFRAVDCDDDDRCTLDGCADRACYHEPAQDPSCCRLEAVDGVSDWDDGAGGGWEFYPAGAPVRWQVADLVFLDSPALYFGDVSTLTYADPGLEPKTVAGVAYSPIYQLPDTEQVKLVFDYYLDVRPYDLAYPSRDDFQVRIVDHLTGAERVLLRTRDVPLPYIGDPNRTLREWSGFIGDFAGGVVSFEVRFDSGDPVTGGGLGVLVDDWRVEAVVCPQ